MFFFSGYEYYNYYYCYNQNFKIALIGLFYLHSQTFGTMFLNQKSN